MKNLFYPILFILLILAAIGVPQLLKRSHNYNLTPTSNNGKKWRIAFYEGGEWAEYLNSLKHIVDELAALNWVEPINMDSCNSTRETWELLSTKLSSQYIEFVKDGYWSSDWLNDQREKNRKEIITRCNIEKDIDLIIAAGTWSGLDLATNEHSTPVIVVSSSDPLKAGIIKSAKYSGFDHVFAICDPNRYVRQIRKFQVIVRFKKLGVVFENSHEGRSWSNIEDLKKVGNEMGFTVVEKHIPDTNLSPEEAKKTLLDAYTEIAPHIDALWLSSHNGENPKNMPEILMPLIKNKVATWSQYGRKHIGRGILVGISTPEEVFASKTNAKVISTIFNGARPGELCQITEQPIPIAFNAKTAELIGFTIPDSVSRISDEIYFDIEGWNER